MLAKLFFIFLNQVAHGRESASYNYVVLIVNEKIENKCIGIRCIHSNFGLSKKVFFPKLKLEIIPL